MMLKRIFPCLLLLFGLTVTAPAAAKEYAIEVIVFDRGGLLDEDGALDDNDDAQGLEDGIVSDDAEEEADEEADEDDEKELSKRTLERLAEMEKLAGKVGEHTVFDTVFRLETVRTSLEESGYRILSLARWQQPTSTYREAPVVSLGDPFTDLAAGFVRVYATVLIYADIHLQLSPRPVTQLPEELEFDAEEVVAEEVVAEEEEAPEEINLEDLPEPTGHYFITEKRRLKFNQIHYFDNPKFGAIVGVWEEEEVEDIDVGVGVFPETN